jgi:ribonuclease Z
VSHLLLTHLHTDHVGELSALLFGLKHGPKPPRSEPLRILGPVGLRAHLEALSTAHGSYIREPGFQVEVTELRPGSDWAPPQGHYSVRTHPTVHTEGSLAYRIDTDQGSFGYTGDTGPAEGLGSFFRGCSVLVAECSNPDADPMDNHLTPGRLALLAGEAEPDLLLNVHAYPPLDPETVPDLLRKSGYTGRASAAEDGTEIRISREGVFLTVPETGRP